MFENNIIFVSEYTAPKGVNKIWTKYIKSGGYRGRKNITSEKLYLI
jgi:hypothetical protein